MQTPLCRHVRTNGTRCGSPSLSGNQWCYFHDRLHHRHRRFRFTEATRGYLIPGRNLELLALEDLESIQLAISVVINALATSTLEPKRASTLLYGLQLASLNAARLHPRPQPSDIVRAVDSSPDGLDFTPSEDAEDISQHQAEEQEQDNHPSATA